MTVQVYRGMSFFLHLITSGLMIFVSLQLSLTHHLSCGDSRGLILFSEALKAYSKVLMITLLYRLVFHIIHLNHVVKMMFSSWILTCSLLL